MKKIYSIISLAAIGLGFVACDDVEESLSQPQTNPQEAIFDAANLTVAPASGVVNLKAANDADQAAQVATYQVSDFPQNSDLSLVMQMSKTDDFAKPASIKVDVDTAGVVNVNPDALQEVYYSKITRDPKEQTVYVRFAASAVNGTEEVRIGGPDAYYGVGELTIKPFDPEKVIEQNYYVAAGTSPEVADAVVMEHSDESQYDDPTFTLVVNVSAEDAEQGYLWYILPESSIGHPVVAYGPEYAEDDQTAGDLVEWNPQEGQALVGKITEQGPHMIKVNMDKLTYEVSLSIEQLYTPGDSNGWNQLASQVLPASWDYINYRGYAHLNGNFKFTSEPNWDGVNYGAAKDDDGNIIPGELSTDGGAGNISVPADALYWCHVNLAQLTYELTEITSMGMIGDFNGWSGQTVMTPSSDFLTWTGDFTIEAGQTWKIRANDNWDINLGGSPDKMVLDGANIECEESGTYTVTLDLSTMPYTATIVKQ